VVSNLELNSRKSFLPNRSKKKRTHISLPTVEHAAERYQSVLNSVKIHEYKFAQTGHPFSWEPVLTGFRDSRPTFHHPTAGWRFAAFRHRHHHCPPVLIDFGVIPQKHKQGHNA
jgi:hypothetical protein